MFIYRSFYGRRIKIKEGWKTNTDSPVTESRAYSRIKRLKTESLSGRLVSCVFTLELHLDRSEAVCVLTSWHPMRQADVCYLERSRLLWREAKWKKNEFHWPERCYSLPRPWSHSWRVVSKQWGGDAYDLLRRWCWQFHSQTLFIQPVRL